MKFFKLLAVVSFVVLPGVVLSQTVIYDIILAGRSVGAVKVLHDDSEPETARRRIEAEISVPFYSGSLISENQFVNGALKTSFTEYKVNGRQKEKVRTSHKTPDHYGVDFFGSGNALEKSTDVQYRITKTIGNLYYEEPVNVNAVYSEKYGQVCNVEKLGNGRYGVTTPNGKQTIYNYINGICSEVTVELSGVKLRIVRKEVKLARR